MMVSYIIPVYNGSASIAKCIEHILAQRGTFDREVIVVNDGSTDDTAAIVERYPINSINRPHKGASATRNFGINRATGDFIVMVDADSFLHPGWTVHALKEPRTSYDILITNIPSAGKGQYITQENLIGFIGNGTLVPKRLKALIQYDEKYIVGGEDVDLLLTLLEKGIRIKAVMGPGFEHKHMHRSTSVKYFSFIKKKILFGYGAWRTYFKHKKSTYAKRDAFGNWWALPFYYLISLFI